MQDQKTLFMPDSPGNKLIAGHKNIIENPNIGLIFFMSNIRENLIINGKAELPNDPELLNRLGARGKPPSFITKITVEESFFHCGKALFRSNLWNPDSWQEPEKISFGKILVGTPTTKETFNKKSKSKAH